MIELRGVCKRFSCGGRHVVALDGAQLRICSGEVVVVSGLSGAGKTTLMKLLYGAELADAGVVKVFEHDIRRLRMSSVGLLRRRIGVVPQNLNLLEDRSALDNVALPLEVRSMNTKVARIRAAEALGAFGLGCASDALVMQLSVGERQRVAVARAIVAEPSLLLFDEPSAHLDAISTEVLVKLIAEQQARSVTGLVISNDPRLLGAATQREWRHLELCEGKLREGSAAAEVAAESTAVAGEIVIEAEEPPNVVPFPISARLGGGE
jgi:ABC-type ATPase involved in cell division